MGAQVGALIFSISIVQLANGFFVTFISLRVTAESFSAVDTALVLSGYFAGFTAGAVFCTRTIERFGHIRAYVAFGGIVVAATAVMPLLVKPLPWLALRAIIGLGCAGLFVTTESWLNAKARPVERGRVFAVYMVGTFVALGLGQLLISRVDMDGPAPFSIIVALFAIALVIVSTTRAEPPRIIVQEAVAYGQLLRAIPVAVAGATLSGTITSVFYALVPVWMQGRNIDSATIGLVMLAAVLGGLTFQLPVGHLSDRLDRRMVLTGLCVGLAGTGFALVHLPRTFAVILPMAALLGGFISTLYPICVAHAHDVMPAERVVPVSGQLILLNGLGAILGPLVGMSLKEYSGIDGILYLIVGTAIVLAVIAAGWSMTALPPHPVRPFEVLAPQVPVVAHESSGAREQ
ncbi:MFS transporter [Bradyrhizobium diazoefficiens]|nr:MFS transporter [Bradyrhizobium diazoefficiens]MBR0775510.1 MFS transporter [Bradyrhizobium diazoefficiens]